jgi:hypothetical protein
MTMGNAMMTGFAGVGQASPVQAVGFEIWGLQ